MLKKQEKVKHFLESEKIRQKIAELKRIKQRVEDMQMIKNIPHSYLGDGLYVKWDNGGLWLMANHHETPTDKVFLEPEVYEALLRFVEDIKKMNRNAK